MIITMKISEISSAECANEIVERLSKLNAQVRNIQVNSMIDHILEYASENMEDDVNREDLKQVINDIITKLSV
jgi:copper chaperone CopZ